MVNVFVHLCLEASVTNYSSCLQLFQLQLQAKPWISHHNHWPHTAFSCPTCSTHKRKRLLSLMWLLHLLSYSHAHLRNSSSLLVVPPQFCLNICVSEGKVNFVSSHWIYNNQMLLTVWCTRNLSKTNWWSSLTFSWGQELLSINMVMLSLNFPVCMMFIYSHLWMFFRENDPSWAIEIQDDVIEECNKHGGIVHIYVDKNSAQVSWSSVFAHSYQITRVSSDFTFLCLI